MYAKIENGLPVEWPVHEFQIRNSVSASLPVTLKPEDVAEYGFEPYAESDKPIFNELVEKVEERAPVKQGSIWVQSWEIIELYDQLKREQVLADDAAKKEAEAANELKSSIVQLTQKRLDDWANTRNYDGILSLCTYATSTVSKFQIEGQRGVDNRDATWSKLYQIMADVKSGARPVPSGYADIEPELPELVWPQ